MIGKICTILMSYYDRKSKSTKFKKRPSLFISEQRNNDYTVLPISTISIKANIDQEYDIPINKSVYPLLNLDKDCYVRTHKQTTVHRAQVDTVVSDMKRNYPDLYVDILAKLEQYNNNIIDDAL